MSTNVLPFERPGITYQTPKQTPLTCYADDIFLFHGTAVLLEKIRDHVEVDPDAMHFLRYLQGEVTWQELCMIQPSAAFGINTTIGFEEVCRLAHVGRLKYANPFSVLCWALFSYRLDISSNIFFEGSEINIGMFPENGHYIAFEHRGTRFNPRLSLRSVSKNTKHGRNSYWIFASLT